MGEFNFPMPSAKPDRSAPFLLTPPNHSEDEKSAVIYKATNRITGWAYIGRTQKTMEERRHFHEKQALLPDSISINRQPGIFDGKPKSANYCRYFYNAMRKYGPESFDWEVVARIPASEAYDAERAAIQAHKTLCPNGYNLERGGKTDFAESPGKPVDYRSEVRTEDIIRLRMAGKTHKAIARELGCGVSIVRGRLRRSRS